jgi:hypothetical protein
MRCWIYRQTQPMRSDSNGPSPSIECGLMCRSIDSEGKTRDHSDFSRRKAAGEVCRLIEPLRRCLARADDCDGAIIIRMKPAAKEQEWRAVIYEPEIPGKAFVEDCNEPNSAFLQRRNHGL